MQYSYNLKKKCIVSLMSIFVFFIFIFLSSFVVIGASAYTPAAPSGVTDGYVNVEYDFSIYSGTVGSYWIFDWGDESQSEWIEVEQAGTYVTQSHSWAEDGDYEVKVKRKDVYETESQWSDPLIISIAGVSPDFDQDGWDNEIEQSYGTDENDPDDYPLDTDGDGIPDDPSSDDKYPGDDNDDNDYLNDLIENQIHTNSKNSNDVMSITIEDVKHCLVDTTEDGTIDKFYNTVIGITSTLDQKNDGSYLIDMDADGQWDYSYHFAYGVSEYEEEKPFEFPLIFLVITVIVVVIIVLFVLFKTGFIYVYEEEFNEEEK